MQIEYFKSLICPRCIPVSRELKKLEKEFPELKIRHIEILKNMAYTKENKIQTIPSLKINDAVIGGLLSGKKVRDFVLGKLNN